MSGNRLGGVLQHLRKLTGAPAAGELTDLQLLERFARGRDEAAFAVLVDRHGPMVLGITRRVLHHAHDAEDAFQATFLVLARRAGSVRWHDSIANWLYGVAYRTALKTRTGAARRRECERQACRTRQACTNGPADQPDLREVLDAEVNRLPAKYQSPLVLCYFEGKTNAEAAQALGWPAGSMARRLARARELLRRRLLRRGVSLPATVVAAALTAEGVQAGPPPGLVESAVQAALGFAAGRTTCAAGVSAPAAVAEGVLQAMFRARLRIASAVLLVVGVLGTGMGLLLHGTANPPHHAALAAAEPPRNAGKVKPAAQPAADQAPRAPVRVLLFAGAPTRDYQFARHLFVREVEAKRAELSICLQSAGAQAVQDVPAERMLPRFPDRHDLKDDSSGDSRARFLNLARYDVIVAFDPDWTRLTPGQQVLLEKWVLLHGGGLVVVAGPVNTFQLARPASAAQLKPVISLFPVVLEDSRLVADRAMTEPWRLHFARAAAQWPFLKLDPQGKGALAGWEEFFTGEATDKPAAGSKDVRGFYTYYPVKKAKRGAAVVATFADPQARLADGAERPYLVTMSHGNGRVVYLGSGETWRLRQWREAFHERFWTALVRYAGSRSLSRLRLENSVPMVNLPGGEREKLWTALLDVDTPEGYRAFYTMIASPGQAVPFLRERLRPAPAVDARRIARLIAQLGDERFAVREKASAGLAQLGDVAEPALRKAQADPQTSAEARQRIKHLLERPVEQILSRPQRRALRAVDVLEQVGTPEARDVLQQLAHGADQSALTRAAKAALRRLQAPPPSGR
jgi:RNA polymerase sigma factor (sigma-70 family)